MVLSKEIYAQLEDIVGPDYISADPAVLDTYTYSLSHTSIHIGPYYDTYTPRGLAVLLPGSTEEVQAIVKLCNKYKIKVKASSTFWSAMGYPLDNNTIQLDMRRMDRILEIDEKNMFAVIEPHVIGATLQAEAMKVGLNALVIGAGASCSPLAGATSYNGVGPSTVFMGTNVENMLGLEWVMPNGDIMRLGSLGSGLGWFYGEGPGPSLRAIARGASGSMGAVGIFTKCALKLSPWPGPASIPVTGTVPAYQAALPDNFNSYTLGFPSWQAWADTVYMLWDAGIGYILHRQFNMLGRELKYAMIKILTDPNRTLSDLEEIMKDPEVQKVTQEMQRDFQIVLVGMTSRDIEWQEKALDEILGRTGGWKVAAMTDDPVVRNWSLLYLLKLGHKNLNLVYGGSFDNCFGLGGPPDFSIRHVEEAAGFIKEWEGKGAIVAGGGDCMMGGVANMGGGGLCVLGNFTFFDPHDRESVEGTYDFFDAASKIGKERKWGPGVERLNVDVRGADGKKTPDEERRRLLSAARQPAVFRYQRRLKEIFDPLDLGDAHYRTLE